MILSRYRGIEKTQKEVSAVLDKIRTEIESISIVRDEYSQRQNDYCDGVEFAKKYALHIIDKYRGGDNE